MVHILLLFAEELSAHSIQCIASKFIVSLHDLKKVELKTTVDIDGFGITLAVCFGAEVGVFDLTSNAYQSVAETSLAYLSNVPGTRIRVF